jgi:hypothetical protein
MSEDLARIATAAARAALQSWSPEDPDSLDRLARAIGEAVAAGVARHEHFAAEHTVLAMEGRGDDEVSGIDWQV